MASEYLKSLLNHLSADQQSKNNREWVGKSPKEIKGWVYFSWTFENRGALEQKHKRTLLQRRTSKNKRVLTARARTQQDPDDASGGGEESSGESSGACKNTDFKAVIRPWQQSTGWFYLGIFVSGVKICKRYAHLLQLLCILWEETRVIRKEFLGNFEATEASDRWIIESHFPGTLLNRFHTQQLK